ncbi:hypothetical protein M0802_007889 [Mischocyttarus mexicanus]|nr:hypothetical protein M0802_007889 [Mischocyttarus mexicanus]
MHSVSTIGEFSYVYDPHWLMKSSISRDLSSCCKQCKPWKNKKNVEEYVECYDDHKDVSSANYSGSLGKMEVDTVIEMFRRSMKKFNVRYRNCIGDSDSKTYSGILKAAPYGEIEVVKKECIGHAQKRMGKQLRECSSAADQKAKLVVFGVIAACVLSTLLAYCYIGECLINEIISKNGSFFGITFSPNKVVFLNDRSKRYTPFESFGSLPDFRLSSNPAWLLNYVSEVHNRIFYLFSILVVYSVLLVEANSRFLFSNSVDSEFTFSDVVDVLLFVSWIATVSAYVLLFKVVASSMTFGESFYHCAWYNISKDEIKLMHICMMRSMKQVQLTVGKFFALSLTTFTDVSSENINGVLICTSNVFMKNIRYGFRKEKITQLQEIQDENPENVVTKKITPNSLPSPIYIEAQVIRPLVDLLKELPNNKLTLRQLKDIHVKVQVNISDSYRNVTKALKKRNAKFYTYQAKMMEATNQNTTTIYRNNLTDATTLNSKTYAETVAIQDTNNSTSTRSENVNSESTLLEKRNLLLASTNNTE